MYCLTTPVFHSVAVTSPELNSAHAVNCIELYGLWPGWDLQDGIWVFLQVSRPAGMFKPGRPEKVHSL